MAWLPSMSPYAFLQKRKGEGLALSEAEARAVQPVVQQRQATYGSSSTPLTSGFNHNFRVLGYTSAQRALFMQVNSLSLTLACT